MRLNVLGLISIDTLLYENGISYIGGGALSTAWITSLCGIPTTLYSIAYKQAYNKIIAKNLLRNKKLFSHIPLSIEKPMTIFEISKCGEDYKYKIVNMNNAEEELKQFIDTVTDDKYIKLPASNFMKFDCLITTASLNPQGRFNLIDFTKRVHTKGFIFLNKNELTTSLYQDLLKSFEYIEKIRQSFVITLAEQGAVCYYAHDSKWYFCPSIQSNHCISSLGCGDAFAGGFLASKAKQYSITDCMFYGTVSAYLATYSPSNMVTDWIDNSYWGDIFDKLKMAISFFQSADELVRFMHSKHCKSIILTRNVNVLHQFDWKLTNSAK